MRLYRKGIYNPPIQGIRYLPLLVIVTHTYVVYVYVIYFTGETNTHLKDKARFVCLAYYTLIRRLRKAYNAPFLWITRL